MTELSPVANVDFMEVDRPSRGQWVLADTEEKVVDLEDGLPNCPGARWESFWSGDPR